MSRNLFGSLEIFTFVHVGAEARAKRVRLATIHCEHGDAAQELDEFRSHNADAINGKKIHGEFTFREYID